MCSPQQKQMATCWLVACFHSTEQKSSIVLLLVTWCREQACAHPLARQLCWFPRQLSKTSRESEMSLWPSFGWTLTRFFTSAMMKEILAHEAVSKLQIGAVFFFCWHVKWDKRSRGGEEEREKKKEVTQSSAKHPCVLMEAGNAY